MVSTTTPLMDTTQTVGVSSYVIDIFQKYKIDEWIGIGIEF